MKIEIFSKEELSNIEFFRKSPIQKIGKMITEEKAENILGRICNSIKYTNDDKMFFKELNKVLISINNDSIKLIEFVSWFYIIEIITNQTKPVLPKELEILVVKFIYKKLNNKPLPTSIVTKTVAELPNELCGKYSETVEDLLSNNAKVFYNTLYLTSYEHWLALMEIVYEVLIVSKKINKYEV